MDPLGKKVTMNKNPCYGIIIYALFVKIINAQCEAELIDKISLLIKLSHLKSSRKRCLRWQRKDVITAASYSYLIPG